MCYHSSTLLCGFNKGYLEGSQGIKRVLGLWQALWVRVVGQLCGNVVHLGFGAKVSEVRVEQRASGLKENVLVTTLLPSSHSHHQPIFMRGIWVQHIEGGRWVHLNSAADAVTHLKTNGTDIFHTQVTWAANKGGRARIMTVPYQDFRREQAINTDPSTLCSIASWMAGVGFGDLCFVLGNQQSWASTRRGPK